jgi:tryptophan synthase alpha chain
MSRLSEKFEKLKTKSQKALVPFITAGHPHPLMTVPTMHALVKNGASIIELGMPFSDPMADGVVIQQSSEEAIEKGMTLSSVLDVVREFREKDGKTPVILMGYLNPIEKFGYHQFVKQASESGVDGLLIVDMPPEEADDLLSLLNQYNMSQIFLIAPTTTQKRQEFILSKSSGFIYCVALKGVTGSNNVDYGDLSEKFTTIRSLTNLPIAIGFGVKDVDSALAVAEYGDAVVIGSALVKKLGKCSNEKEIKKTIKKFIKPIAKALNKD